MKVESEASISLFQSRQVGLFDWLERNGDFKIIMPEQYSILPSFGIVREDGDSDEEELPLSYVFPEVSLTRLEHAYVSATGTVVKDEVAISESVEGDLAQSVEDLTSGLPVGLSMAVCASSRFGNFNHAVFCAETLPLIYLAALDRQTHDIPRMLYFDKRYCSLDYEQAHLELIGKLGLSTGTGAWLDHPTLAEVVYLPSISRREGASRASLLTPFVSQLASNLCFLEAHPSPSPRIYISRRFANSRSPVNVDELEAIASTQGFIVVHLERMPIVEQIQLFQSARFIIAEHGAGLVNLTFCRPGVRVIELFPDKMYGHWTFRLLSHVIGLQYKAGFFAVDDEWRFNSDPVYVPSLMFFSALKWLLDM